MLGSFLQADWAAACRTRLWTLIKEKLPVSISLGLDPSSATWSRCRWAWLKAVREARAST